MKTSFLKNIFLLLLINLIVKPIWIFGIDRNVQNLVGHEIYGQYQALFNLSMIFQVFLDFGLQNYNSQMVAKSPMTIKNTFPNILIGKGLLGITYFILLTIIGLIMGFHGKALWMLEALGFVQILNSMLLYLRSSVAGMQHFKTDSILSVLDRFVLIFICGLMLYTNFFKSNFRIEWFIYAQIFSNGIAAIVALSIVVKYASFDLSKLHLGKVWIILKQSLPYAILIFLMALYLKIDAPLLDILLHHHSEETGRYAAAYRLLDAANNISGVLIANILLPLFSKLIAQKQQEELILITKQTVNILIPLSIFAILVCGIMGTEIMAKLYTHSIAQDGLLLFILFLAYPGFCIGYIYATMVTAAGNIKALIKISVVALILNLFLNTFLIPKYGAIGAAISAAGTQILLIFLNLNLAKHITQIKITLKSSLRYLLFIIILAIGIIAIQHYMQLHSFIKLGISVLLFVLLWVGLGFLAEPKKLLSLIKKKTT